MSGFHRWLSRSIAGLLLLSATAPTFADDTLDAAIGGGVGGALGAAIGNEVGGREGAILGGAVGAAGGAAVASDDAHHHQARERRYRDPYRGSYNRRGKGRGAHGFCPPGLAKQGRC